jgi:hypothetical protein
MASGKGVFCVRTPPFGASTTPAALLWMRIVPTSKVPRCDEHSFKKGEAMGTILLIILILLLIGALPAWPYSSGWGYWPSGGLGLILLILIIFALTGNL